MQHSNTIIVAMGDAKQIDHARVVGRMLAGIPNRRYTSDATSIFEFSWDMAAIYNRFARFLAKYGSG